MSKAAAVPPSPQEVSSKLSIHSPPKHFSKVTSFYLTIQTRLYPLIHLSRNMVLLGNQFQAQNQIQTLFWPQIYHLCLLVRSLFLRYLKHLWIPLPNDWQVAVKRLMTMTKRLTMQTMVSPNREGPMMTPLSKVIICGRRVSAGRLVEYDFSDLR